jgi:hypothetical protein
MTVNYAQIATDERLPWHKPEVQRLEVSLDTRIRIGSDTDGGTGSAGFD